MTEPQPTSQGNGNGFKLLIVEDHTESRDSLMKLLSRAGYRVEQAESGEEALHSFYTCDAVVMDVKLPGIDGVETARRMQDLQRDKKVIVVTAYPWWKQQAQIKGIRVEAWFEKPVFVEPQWDALLNILDGLRKAKTARLILLSSIASELERAEDNTAAELEKHESFLNAKEPILSKLWDLFKESEIGKRHVAIMLRIVTRQLSFVSSPSGNLRRPTPEQISVLIEMLDKLKQTYVNEDDEWWCESRLNAVGLDVDLEVFGPEAADKHEFIFCDLEERMNHRREQ